MPVRGFHSSVQSAVPKTLKRWRYLRERTDAGGQTFTRALDDSGSMMQLISFQESYGDQFFVEFWFQFIGGGKGGAPISYPIIDGSRLAIDLRGKSFEERIYDSATTIDFTADQYAALLTADLHIINKLITNAMPEYAAWRHNLPAELIDLASHLNTRLSADRVRDKIDSEEKDASWGTQSSKKFLWADFREWYQTSAETGAGIAEYFEATPGAQHQLMPYPGLPRRRRVARAVQW